MNDNNQSIIITGASGFIGHYLLEDLKNDYRIFAIARRSQYESNIAADTNVAWLRTDISDYDNTAKTFREISTAGGADFLIHLAAYYDFTGKNNPQYKTTNIQGTKNVLEIARTLNLKMFIFASSVIASSFPKKGQEINENSIPDGQHYYARSKSAGEEMISKVADTLPCCIVRFGAVYSDWCEYPPLYVFLNTWLGKSLRKYFLAGKGQSAVPYIHIRDIISFFRQLLINYKRVKSGQVMIASTSKSTSHKKLYTLANRYFYGIHKKSIQIPKILCWFSLHMLNILGYITQNHPFERPWMARYIDLQLNVDNKQTRSLLKWDPLERHIIDNRMAYLVERLKSEPHTWKIHNEALLEKFAVRPDLNFYTLLVADEDKITSEVIKQILISAVHEKHHQILRTDKTDLLWFIKLMYRLLLTSIHNSKKLLIHNYFELLSFNRFEAGFSSSDIIFILNKFKETVISYLSNNDQVKFYTQEIYDLISMPLEFAVDEIDYQYQNFLKRDQELPLKIHKITPEELKSARSQLEETIWSCLVHRI